MSARPGDNPYRNALDLPGEARWATRTALEAVRAEIAKHRESVSYAAYRRDGADTVLALDKVLTAARAHEAALLDQLAKLDRDGVP